MGWFCRAMRMVEREREKFFRTWQSWDEDSVRHCWILHYFCFRHWGWTTPDEKDGGVLQSPAKDWGISTSGCQCTPRTEQEEALRAVAVDFVHSVWPWEGGVYHLCRESDHGPYLENRERRRGCPGPFLLHMQTTSIQSSTTMAQSKASTLWFSGQVLMTQVAKWLKCVTMAWMVAARCPFPFCPHGTTCSPGIGRAPSSWTDPGEKVSITWHWCKLVPCDPGWIQR
jgi:hypothetical protein